MDCKLVKYLCGGDEEITLGIENMGKVYFYPYFWEYNQELEELLLEVVSVEDLGDFEDTFDRENWNLSHDFILKFVDEGVTKYVIAYFDGEEWVDVDHSVPVSGEIIGYIFLRNAEE